MESTKKTCLFSIIEEKVRDELRSTAILIIKEKDAKDFGKILDNFTMVANSLREGLKTEGTALVKLPDSTKAQPFFNQLKSDYNNEPLSFVLLDDTGTVIDFFPQKTFVKK